MKDALERSWPECGPYERALMLALADVVSQRDAWAMEEEARQHKLQGDLVTAQAIKHALVLGCFGVEFSERRLRSGNRTKSMSEVPTKWATLLLKLYSPRVTS